MSAGTSKSQVMLRALLIGVSGGLVVLLGLRLLPRETPVAPAVDVVPAPDLSVQIEELRDILEQEIRARIALSDQVNRLRTEAGSAAEAPAPDAPSQPTPATPPTSDARQQPRFDAELLSAAGVETSEIDVLREVWQRVEMDRLYVNDRAAREGWLFSPRHRQELRALEDGLRDELGTESWERLLYATGQPNRVMVGEVLDASPARSAGLEPGDWIVSYDGERIFEAGELRGATTLGEPGENVPIEVRRGGSVFTLYARRGPLGVYLKTASLPPEPR